MKKFFLMSFISLIMLTQNLTFARANDSLHYPGQVLQAPSGLKIVLESGRFLEWPDQGPLLLKNAEEQELFRVDLSAQSIEDASDENLGIELQESDLGSQGSKKSYLKGEKKPQGKSFREKNNDPIAEKNQNQVNEITQNGVRIIEEIFPNQAKKLRFYWSSGLEEVEFDRRGTLQSSKASQKIGPLDYSLQQWMEGSYQRRFHQASGEVRTTFDINDRSLRLDFYNAQGELIGNYSCQETCQKI